MKKQEFLSILTEGLKSNFDVTGETEICGRRFDLVGQYRERVSRYMISKQKEIYAYQSYEHIMYSHFEVAPTEVDIGKLRLWLEEQLSDIIQIDSEHMSSVVTIIWSSNEPIEKKVAKSIKRFRLYQSFQFGLKGWVNVKLVHVDLSQKRMVSNRMGRDVSKLVGKSLECRGKAA